MSIRSSQAVQQAIDEQTGRIEDRLEAIRRDVANIGSPITNAINRHPTLALGIALGTGVTLGVLAGRSLRSDKVEAEPPNSASPRQSRLGQVAKMMVPVLLDYGLKYFARIRS
ncbi:MAG: hypothetical protein OXU68_12070 [Bacteroidota bacterium]|nr:hypothetical protein [Bacteroidota bacterium]